MDEPVAKKLYLFLHPLYEQTACIRPKVSKRVDRWSDRFFVFSLQRSH